MVVDGELKACIEDGFFMYADEISDLALDYMDKHQNVDETLVKEKIKKTVINKLLKNCPRVREVSVNKVFKSTYSNKGTVADIANKICNKLSRVNESKLTLEMMALIFERYTAHYKDELATLYDMDTKAGNDKYITDLVNTLVLNCEVYSAFTRRYA